MGDWILYLGGAITVAFMVATLSSIVARGDARGPRHPSPDRGPDPLEVERELLLLLGQARGREGAPPLGIDTELEEMARHRALALLREVEAPSGATALAAFLHPRLVGIFAEVIASSPTQGPAPDGVARTLVATLARSAEMTDPRFTRWGVGVAAEREKAVACLVLARRLARLDSPVDDVGFRTEPMVLRGETLEGAFTGLRLTLHREEGWKREVPVHTLEGGRFEATLDFREGPGALILRFQGREEEAVEREILVRG